MSCATNVVFICVHLWLNRLTRENGTDSIPGMPDACRDPVGSGIAGGGIAASGILVVQLGAMLTRSMSMRMLDV